MLIGREKEKHFFDKLRSRGDLSGSYLFFGEKKVGKYAFAEELVRSFENNAKHLIDALIISPDKEKASIGIDAIREIQHFISIVPYSSKYRSVIVKDAELMTDDAQNAVLKIAEEPGQYGLLIFIAPSKEVIFKTLASRLKAIHFKRVDKSLIADWLMHHHQIDKEIAVRSASMSFGRPSLALEIALGKIEEKILPKDNKFNSEAEYHLFLEKGIFNLYHKENKNLKHIAEFIQRSNIAFENNINKKLQLKSMPWIH